MTEDLWYQELRERYRPDRVCLLLIGESAPTDHGGTKPRNFFYADHLAHDNLYRGVISGLYCQDSVKKDGHDKPAWLRRLQADGVFLIDAVPYPVNDDRSTAERRRDIRDHASGCVDRATTLAPDGIIVCGGIPVCKILMPRLQLAGLPLLHNEPIVFPARTHKQQFVDAFRRAVEPLGLVDLGAGAAGS